MNRKHSKMFSSTLVVICLSWLYSKEAAAQTTAQLPVFSVHPQSHILASAQSVNLTCSASSPTPFSYQWLRNGMSISGVSRSWYVVTIGAGGEGSGEYSCLARNTVGTVTSRVSTVQQAVLSQSFFSTSSASPRQVTVPMGATAVISCGSYTSVPELLLTWEIYHETANIRIDAQDKAIVGLNGDLYLQAADTVNEATYECVARNRVNGIAETGFVQVIVEATEDPPSPPTILSPPQDTMVNEEDDAFFECIVGGSPLADVVWNLPSNSSNVRFDQNGARLRVRDVGTSDVGTYTCSADGVGMYSATLSLAQAPVIATPLPSSPTRVEYGSLLTLVCGSSQSETEDWQWFFNGEKLSSETGPSLEVADAVLGDSGAYQCFLSNSAGFDSSTALVEVFTVPPSFITPLATSQIAFMDQPLNLTCRADGAPPPTYVWTKESVPLSSGSAFDLLENGVLTVLNVDSTSGGNYTCVASNSVEGMMVGSASTSTILTAIEPTVITREPGALFKIQVGTPGSLDCEVTGDPGSEVEFSWTKDGEALSITERITRESTSSGNIQITTAEKSDAGEYICTVSTRYNNIVGPLVKTTPTNLTIIDVPVAPIIISVTPVSPTSLTVQWRYLGSPADLSSYIIETQPSGEDGWSQAVTQPASQTTDAVIEGLSPFTTYSVRVVAVTRGGDSSERMSDVVSARTFADVPSSPPLAISVIAPNNTALRFSWEEPAESNGVIIDYVIQYRLLRDQADVDYTTVRVESGTALTFVIAGLIPLERYEFRMAAETSAGVGPYSEVQFTDTVAVGTVTEPEPGPFHTQIWFIAVMAIVVIIIIVVVAVVILLVRYYVRHHKVKGTYSFTDKLKKRTSAVFGADNDEELSHEAFRDYCAPRNQLAMTTIVNNGTDIETEMDFMDSQSLPPSTISASSRSNLISQGPAPGYIHPPSFQEATSRPRTHSVHSVRSSIGANEYYEDEVEQGSEYIDEPLSGINISKRVMEREDYMGRPPSRQDGYQMHQALGGFGGYSLEEKLDSDSLGKPSLVSSSGTEYSHLQAMGEMGYTHLQTAETNHDHATFV